MTHQEIFDTVAAHLLKQGRRSMRVGSDYCAYRSHDGLKCAVGCLIRDDEYSPEMEGLGIVDLAYRKMLPENLRLHLKLLLMLQDVHDSKTPEWWPRLLLVVAKKFHLSTESIP